MSARRSSSSVTRRAALGIFALGTLGLAAACEAIPELNFPDQSGTGPDGSVLPDGAPRPDGGSSGAIPDGGGGRGDAGDGGAGCASPMPATAVLCCGKTWCGGPKCGAACTDCESLGCATGAMCCTRGNGQVSCGDTCP
jgi:hypothetical protein